MQWKHLHDHISVYCRAIKSTNSTKRSPPSNMEENHHVINYMYLKLLNLVIHKLKAILWNSCCLRQGYWNHQNSTEKKSVRNNVCTWVCKAVAATLALLSACIRVSLRTTRDSRSQALRHWANGACRPCTNSCWISFLLSCGKCWTTSKRRVLDWFWNRMSS